MGIIAGASGWVEIWFIACVSYLSMYSFVNGSGYGVSDGVLALSGDISFGSLNTDANITSLTYSI